MPAEFFTSYPNIVPIANIDNVDNITIETQEGRKVERRSCIDDVTEYQINTYGIVNKPDGVVKVGGFFAEEDINGQIHEDVRPAIHCDRLPDFLNIGGRGSAYISPEIYYDDKKVMMGNEYVNGQFISDGCVVLHRQALENGVRFCIEYGRPKDRGVVPFPDRTFIIETPDLPTPAMVFDGRMEDDSRQRYADLLQNSLVIESQNRGLQILALKLKAADNTTDGLCFFLRKRDFVDDKLVDRFVHIGTAREDGVDGLITSVRKKLKRETTPQQLASLDKVGDWFRGKTTQVNKPRVNKSMNGIDDRQEEIDRLLGRLKSFSDS